MGLQQKRKDPRKKKKPAEVASEAVAEKQTDKSRVFSSIKSGLSAKPKATPADQSRKNLKVEEKKGVFKYIDLSLQFLREVRIELKKVTWPSRKQTIGSTAVVLLMVILVSIFLGIVDFGLSSLVRLVIG
jgi:preprotein translocase subunit SecE